MLKICKIFVMSFLLTTSVIESSAATFGGGVVDILQVGRNAVVINIYQSKLAPDIQNETITVQLIRSTDRAILTDATDTNLLALPLLGLPDGVYILKVIAGDITLAEQEIVL